MDAMPEVLIVSCRSENERMLSRVLDGLPLSRRFASTLREAKQLLAERLFTAVFCEERLADGSYPELLDEVRLIPCKTQFVVMLCTGGWREYAEALELGVDEVLHCPFQRTDRYLATVNAMKGASWPQEAVAHV